MRQLARVLTLALGAGLLLAGCAGYGGRTAGEDGSALQVQTDGEHCMVTLPPGWTWYPASWTAVSPNGTSMTFQEALYGRPEHPDWEEARRSTVEEVRRRVPAAQVTEDEDTVRIDYGPDAGLTVLQKFDRVGCQLTFSTKRGTRASEQAQWEAIIASLERTSPTPGFTPSATD